MECLPQFLLAAFPEGRSVVQVETDQGPVCLRRFDRLQAAFRRLGAHGSDQAGQVQDADALLPEDLFHVKVFRRKRPPDLAGTVVPHPWCPQPEAGVGNVELMAEAPRPALRDFFPDVGDVPRAEFGLDEGRDRTAFHEFRHGEAFPAEARGHVQHVGLGAGRLHHETLAVLDRHAVFGGDTDSHAGHAGDGMGGIGTKGNIHRTSPYSADSVPIIHDCFYNGIA